MKKKTKGILAFAFLGGIMVTSGVTIALPGIDPPGGTEQQDLENLTPAEYFTEEQRPQFCGSSIARSTAYVQEFSIPTICTNPLGITTDYDGNVWFGQTNTGRVAMFDPVTEEFAEYDNPTWPLGTRSMMWGMAYAPDGHVWYTDDTYDSLWRFSPATGEYERLQFPSDGDSLPQKLEIDGSQIIVNDFTGNKLTFFSSSPNTSEISYLNIPSPFNGSQAADFAVDPDNNVWFTTWSLQSGGILVKFDQDRYLESISNPLNVEFPLFSYMEIFGFPANMLTPNGAAVTPDGTLWLADTTSSSFYSFDPATEQFIQYVTADPLPSTYGNHTGIIKSPISRPYWIAADDAGRLVFNSQGANNLSVMDPLGQTLVEYHVPSKNPYWNDCAVADGSLVADCGLAQVFDFTIHEDKIWFTEWVENNIGVVDTSVPLPFDVRPGPQAVVLSPGDAANVALQVASMSEKAAGASLVMSGTHDFITVSHPGSGTLQLSPGEVASIETTITASDTAIPGTYKVLLGVQSSEVTVGKFVTVTVQ